MEASDVIKSVEVIEATEVLKTTLVLEINKLMYQGWKTHKKTEVDNFIILFFIRI